MSVHAVVIGAGVNGLVAAHYLARRGHRVTVLERRIADAAPPPPDTGWVPPRVIRDLGLARHGLRVTHPDPWAAVPLPAGGRLELRQDPTATLEAIRRVSPADAAKWTAFSTRMARLARLLETLYTQAPPDLQARSPAGLLSLARLGWRVRRLGREGMIDLFRTLPMSVWELLDDWFEHDALKGALGAAGVMHLRQGPRSGGTAFALLHHSVGSAAGVFRPPLSNVGQVLAALPGVELRRGAAVVGIAVREGRAGGVTLAGGEEIAADVVLSSADPRQTLGRLVDPRWLDPGVVRAIRHIKCRGVAARVSLTLSRAPGFACLTVAPSLDYLERAYDDAKYQRVSARPWIEARANGTVPGEHHVDVHVQYAPYAPDGGWDDPRRSALGDRVVGLLEEHAPGLAGAIADRAVLTPVDLEAAYGFPEGHAYHGELTLDQILFMRPVPGWARYRTPIVGLYLCGSGTHPGGAVPGAAGMNAAGVVLEDLRRGMHT